MDTWYDPRLVVLSIAVSVAASFTALSLADRLRGASGGARIAWLIGAATAMGGGIWSMHFVAMLAFHFNAPVAYHLGLTLLSLGMAIGVTGAGFAIVAYRGDGAPQLLAGGVFMGLGVATMHYIGMEAMEMPMEISYDAALASLSIAIAVVASVAALWLSFNTKSLVKKIAAAMAMGAAVCGMHYTGMAAASYAPMLDHAHGAAPEISSALLAVAIVLVTFGVLFTGLLSAIVDQRFAQRAHEANVRLIAEAAERARAQAELKAAHDNLERLVAERTSEMHAALLAARAASEAKSEFLAAMSHELRTPLNAIIGYSEIMLEDAEADGRRGQVTDLARITNSGSHLLSLINNVLDLSRIEAGRLDLSVENFSLDGFVSDMVAACEPLARKNGNRVLLRPRPELGQVRGDATKLRQCALNLLGNASKFTKDGEIEIDARRDYADGGEDFVFEVRDTGLGIAPEHLRRLFRPFTQADTGIAGKFGGAGLGLSLSQQLCQLMGGRIEVESEVGVGSTFTLRIPIELSELASPGTLARPAPLGEFAARRGAVALLIDDDPTVCDLATRILSKEGYKLLLASTAEQGWEIARVSRPDVIILDVLLPGQDGFELLRQLKDDDRLRHIPVVMLSMVDERRRGIELGAVEYLVKPVERAMLVGAIHRTQLAA